MEEFDVPTPIAQHIEILERTVAELECETGIASAKQNLDVKIAALLRCQAKSIASEAKDAALQFSQKAAQVLI